MQQRREDDSNGPALSRIARGRGAYQARQLSSVEATQAQLDRIARLDGSFKSYAKVAAN
jgi:Asp-tRNA(Asn)/Glu-tRNA(Gln) amidotransferase A subunit family amidase